MPWCEECARYFTPNSVRDDGGCPRCGDTIQLPEGAGNDEEAPAADEKAPWHFKLMVVMVVAYLVWRTIQLLT